MRKRMVEKRNTKEALVEKRSFNTNTDRSY